MIGRARRWPIVTSLGGRAVGDPKADQVKPTAIWFRLLALTFTPIYLLIWAVALRESTRLPLVATFSAVVVGAFVVMGVLVAFGLKTLEGKERVSRFNLSSIMLVMVPLAAYLAALRAVLAPLPLNNLGAGGWAFLAAASMTFMIVTTIVLLAFAEALAWLGLKGLSLVRRVHSADLPLGDPNAASSQATETSADTLDAEAGREPR
jgi:hypothetical protein